MVAQLGEQTAIHVPGEARMHVTGNAKYRENAENQIARCKYELEVASDYLNSEAQVAT